MLVAAGCGSDSLPSPIVDGSNSSTDANLEAAPSVEERGRVVGDAEPFFASDGDDHVPGPNGSSDASDVGNQILGTVVDFLTHRPLPGRKVSTAGDSTESDERGQFLLNNTAAPYDITIVDPDGSTISIFRGLTRRDPVLVHHRSATSDPFAASATFSGRLTGGGPYPLGGTDSAAVYLFSEQADSYDLLGGGLSEPFVGPAFGPMRLSWNGAAAVSARVLAVGVSHGATQGTYSASLADQSVSLSSGDMVNVDLTLMPVSQVHIAGTIDSPTGSSIVQKQIFYRLPLVHASISLGAEPNSSSSFDYMIADLGTIGELCVGAAGSPGLFVTQRCGIKAGTTDARITLQASPWLSSPADGSVATRATSFTWSNFEQGVYSLALEASGANRQSPSIYLFTTEKTSAWPDLSAIGVPFPSRASYQCTIGGLGPFASIDQAVGPGGLGDPFPSEARRSYAQSIYLTTGR